MKKGLSRIVSVLALGTLPLAGQATIIDHDSYLTDTVTGLDWLDVTQSFNMSYNQVSLQLGAGGQFEGWRYATGDEFNQLLVNFTGVVNNGYGRTDTTGTTPSVDGLVAMLGSTLDAWEIRIHGSTWDAQHGYAEGAGLDFTRGITADTDTFGRHWMATIRDEERTPMHAARDFYMAHNNALSGNANSLPVGSFLVRNAVSVPEPGSLAMLGIGLAGLGLSRRKK